MKKLLSITLLLLTTQAIYAQDLSKVSWMLGKWKSVNAKTGNTSYENWTRISDQEWSGKGFRLSRTGTDTLFSEKMTILVKDNNLYYVADVKENAAPVYFKFTAINEQGFTCENPQHDFPKKISYLLEGKKLKATISGDGKEFSYYFDR
ncbi:hypothetical protein GFS24_01800 [Chitinophaga sp. SYP-B3965]|uniref:DUF6265 family protein n=1 Tax=Chitinophaga sp. SYP-B3965 TaxID=2663120 RepID=UPI00129965F6|nr:DUF6265 family protein [Chitinophaga sp. SYP-B3965]MRG43825.1 hypothetical protein [Chitinophaga sp. SYP-B3965]